MLLILVSFLLLRQNTWRKSKVRKERYFGSHCEETQSITEEKAWTQEPEAAGHFASTVKKQKEMDAHAQLALLFKFSPGSESMAWRHSYSGWVFVFQLHLSGNTLPPKDVFSR